MLKEILSLDILDLMDSRNIELPVKEAQNRAQAKKEMVVLTDLLWKHSICQGSEVFVI